MRITRLIVPFALLFTSGLGAQNPPAPASITPRLDMPQARVIVATLQPRTPSIAKNGHVTNRVPIYLDNGVMTRKEGDQSTRIEFRRGDVRWRPASGAYIAENISDHPIRILEVDLKGRRSRSLQRAMHQAVLTHVRNVDEVSFSVADLRHFERTSSTRPRFAITAR